MMYFENFTKDKSVITISSKLSGRLLIIQNEGLWRWLSSERYPPFDKDDKKGCVKIVGCDEEAGWS